jgi:hypothetical protein
MKALKIIIPLVFSLFAVQCKYDKDVKKIISRFGEKNVEDVREEVFSVSFEHVGGVTYILKGDVGNVALKRSLVRELIDKGFHIQDSIRVLPAGVTEPWALVELSVTTLRTSPSHTSSMVSQALMGSPLRVLKEEGDWVYVQTSDRYLGWTEKGALHFMDESSLNNWKSALRVMVIVRGTEIRDRETDRVVSDLVAGDLLETSGVRSGHIMVTSPGGRSGYVLGSEVVAFNEAVFPDTVDVKAVKESALNLLGTPYLWGGTSVRALDCSGFIKTVYQLHGLVLPRDASLQARYGEEIPLDKGWRNFEIGDLLFFAPHEGSKRITHVGLYIGNSEFIHEAGRAKINSLDSTRENYNPSRKHTLTEVRRIKGMEGTEGIIPITQHPWYVNL